MKTHERFKAAAKGKPVDRLPMIEWAFWWDKTVDNWDNQRPELKLKEKSAQELHSHWGLDINLQRWFSILSPRSPVPKYHGGPIINTLEEYQSIKHTLYPEPNLTPEFVKLAKELHENGTGVVWFSVESFFWAPRVLLGIENHLYAFYDEPELYKQICEDILLWQKRVLEVCANTCDFDFMTFAEDMSYNNGPMISKECFDEFMAPYYKKIVPLIKNAGILSMVDSDGDITKAVDWFANVGVEGMLPLERQAGVDVALYLDKQPEMFFFGHFDKMIMHKGEAELRKEFERLLPSMKRGRFIPSVDHQTPPAVSYDDYNTYMKLFEEYAIKATKK